MFGKYETHSFTTQHGSTRTIEIPKDGDAWQLYSTKGAGLSAAGNGLGIDVALDVRAMCERGEWRLYRLRDGTVRMARERGRGVE